MGGGVEALFRLKKKVESFLTNLFGHSTLHCHAASRDGAHADTDRGENEEEPGSVKFLRL